MPSERLASPTANFEVYHFSPLCNHTRQRANG